MKTKQRWCSCSNLSSSKYFKIYIWSSLWNVIPKRLLSIIFLLEFFEDVCVTTDSSFGLPVISVPGLKSRVGLLFICFVVLSTHDLCLELLLILHLLNLLILRPQPAVQHYYTHTFSRKMSLLVRGRSWNFTRQRSVLHHLLLRVSCSHGH